MTVFLITYDLNKETTRPNIVKHIKDGFEGWAKLSESSYAIKTNLSEVAVWQYMATMLDGNDNMYIIQLKRPYIGRGPKEVNDWLETNLQW